MQKIIALYVLLLVTSRIMGQSDSLYFFDFEQIDTTFIGDRFIIRNNQGVFKEAEPFLLLGNTVSYGNSHSLKTSDYRKFDVGRLFLYHMPSWYTKRYSGTSYNHIELDLDDALPHNNYYELSFVIGNMKSHRFKPGHYGVKFSDKKIIKNHPGDLLSEPDIFFNFTKDQELGEVHAVYYASKEVKYIYFGMFKEDSSRVPKVFTKLSSKVSYSDTAAHVFTTKPTRVIIDNIVIKELTPYKVKFRDVFFETNKDIFQQEVYLQTIEEISSYLSAHPNSKVLVQGSTDKTGTATYNIDLSERRAENIKSMIVSRGIDHGRILTLGKGMQTTSKDNSMDRKVSFLIFN